MFPEKNLLNKLNWELIDCGINNEDILFLGETDIDIVNQNIIGLNPKLVIIDSIQTMYSEEISAAARKCKPGQRNYFSNYESVQI